MQVKYQAYPTGDKGEIYVELDTDTLFREVFTLGLRHMND